MPLQQSQQHHGGGSPTNRNSSNSSGGMLFSSIFGSSGSVGSNLRCIFISLSAIYILLMIRLQTQLQLHQQQNEMTISMMTSTMTNTNSTSDAGLLRQQQMSSSSKVSTKSRIRQEQQHQQQQFHSQEDSSSSSITTTNANAVVAKAVSTTPAPTPSPTVAVTPKQTFSQDVIDKELALMDFYEKEIQYFMSLQSSSAESSGSFLLWDNDDDSTTNMVMPTWMKKYLTWHHYQRLTIHDIDGFDEHLETINVTDIFNFTTTTTTTTTVSSSTTNNATLEKLAEEQFQKHKFLIMQCIGSVDYRCGGLSDRLRILPYMLRLAYETKRILLIYWTKPTSLEEFLLPPTGGINWRTPNWLQYRLNDPMWFRMYSGDFQGAAKRKLRVARTKFQDTKAGEPWYNEKRNILVGTTNTTSSTTTDIVSSTNNVITTMEEPNYEQVFKYVWKVFFTPIQPIQNKIISELHRMKLIPGQYVTAHLRALYDRTDRVERVQKKWSINAINCATEIRPGASIFFVSDSRNATVFATLHYNNEKEYQERLLAEGDTTTTTTVLGTRTPDPNPPLHIDTKNNWHLHKASDFYDTFIDLYLISLGGCVTYNIGGFGYMGYLMSAGYDSSCRVRQDALTQPKIKKPCSWTNPGDNVGHELLPAKIDTVKDNPTEPYFIPPME